MRSLLVFTLITLLAGLLRAQSTNASLSGRVTDPSKAVITGAQVSAINAGTSLRYESVTNSSGQYYLTNLPPGAYRLEIEKAGFKKLIKPDVTLPGQERSGKTGGAAK